MAVSLFFVISGFFYYKETAFSKENYVISVCRKFKKIYPPHVLFLTIGVVLLLIYLRYDINDYSEASQWFSGFWQKKVTAIDYLKACSVVIYNDTNLINPPIWYLMAEVTMFLVMPLLVPLLNKVGWAYSLIIIVLCARIKIPFIPWVGNYLLGALFHRFGKQIIQYIDMSKITILVAAFIGVLLLNIENEIAQNNRTTAMLSCLGDSIIITILYYKRVIIFEHNVFQFIGIISYEFYLCHFIVLLSLRPFISNSYWLIVFAVSLSILLSAIVNRMNLGSLRIPRIKY